MEDNIKMYHENVGCKLLKMESASQCSLFDIVYKNVTLPQ